MTTTQTKAHKSCQALADYYKADPSKWVQEKFGYYDTGMCVQKGLIYFSGHKESIEWKNTDWFVYHETLKLLELVGINEILKWNDNKETKVEHIIETLEKAANYA